MAATDHPSILPDLPSWHRRGAYATLTCRECPCREHRYRELRPMSFAYKWFSSLASVCCIGLGAAWALAPASILSLWGVDSPSTDAIVEHHSSAVEKRTALVDPVGDLLRHRVRLFRIARDECPRSARRSCKRGYPARHGPAGADDPGIRVCGVVVEVFEGGALRSCPNRPRVMASFDRRRLSSDAAARAADERSARRSGRQRP
jgi:hypothetical protein